MTNGDVEAANSVHRKMGDIMGKMPQFRQKPVQTRQKWPIYASLGQL
jgi:hypothetical protein